MSNSSTEIQSKISDLESKIATLKHKADQLRATSAEVGAVRSNYAFAALAEGDAESKQKMDEYSIKLQELELEGCDVSDALAIANKKLADLNVDLESVIRREKIEQIGELCKEVLNLDAKFEELVAPFANAVKDASDLENKISVALFELGEIVRPKESRRAFDPNVAIESRARDLIGRAEALAAHALAQVKTLRGVTISRFEFSSQRTFDWYKGKIETILNEVAALPSGVSRLAPSKSRDQELTTTGA